MSAYSSQQRAFQSTRRTNPPKDDIFKFEILKGTCEHFSINKPYMLHNDVTTITLKSPKLQLPAS